MRKHYRSRVLFYTTALILLAGVGCLVAGIVLMVRAKDTKLPQIITQTAEPSVRHSAYSNEAKRVGLDRLLQEVQDMYFKLYPNKIAFYPGITETDVMRIFRPYDPTPEIIKRNTDESRKLYTDLENLEFAKDKLKLFEKRALAKAKYWVYHVFAYGVPYGYDYYNGDWMLGPDVFGWSAINHIKAELNQTVPHFKPFMADDVDFIVDRLVEVGYGVMRYMKNLQLGVQAGMVRSIEECEGGLYSVKNEFRDISLGGEMGVLNMSFAKQIMAEEYLSELHRQPSELLKWGRDRVTPVNGTLQDALIRYVGRPLHSLIRYLETNYSRHCVRSNISSGLSSLPLPYVYVDNVPTHPSTGRLPTGERLNGTEIYRKLMAYFTTTEDTPDEIHKLGEELLPSLYEELLQLARKISGEKDNDKAKLKVQEEFNKPSNYFNETSIPANESDKNAHKLCSSVDTAKAHCPVRWRAMENWFQYVRQLSTLLNTKIMDLFHMVGSKTSVPSCPFRPEPDFNPLTATPKYHETDPECSKPATYGIPFFVQKPGPKWQEWTTTSHEVSPGHHLQVQVFNEHFASDDEGVARWLSSTPFFLTFSEGWALYAEHLMAHETDLYDEEPMIKFYAVKAQMIQAMQLIIDTGLHSRRMSRDEALAMYRQYSWDTTDIPAKEITRYQSVPGQAVSYMFGKLKIMEARREAKRRLGSRFNIKDFHFQMLRHGPSPLGYMQEAMRKYVDCELNHENEGCDEVLRPVTSYNDEYLGMTVLSNGNRR
ncbi:uncharacterized protein LOC5504853 [Nematostella vectensis]|uniref:uncharacterized protein LOC5504853 n=1 Tax=Nematostella vectensis TaxID=45351 RepID=UPI00138FE935|nr:uncharacterized protein LOC5504853 [Nematostella vectensis]